jgi:hypothetical protein
VYETDTVLIDSGNNGLTIQNYEGEGVTVSGGRAFRVDRSSWQPYIQRKGWEVQPNQNNVYGQAVSMADTETIKFLGKFGSVDECLAAAKADGRHKGPFRSFTFHSPSFSDSVFRSQCFGRTDDLQQPVAQQNVSSGFLFSQNTWVADVSHLGIKSIPGLRLNGQRAIRAKYARAVCVDAVDIVRLARPSDRMVARYPNGDPEQSGEFLRGESADMGGGDYIKGWVRHPERLHDAYYNALRTTPP